MILTAIKRNWASLTVCAVASALAVVGIIFEAKIVIVPLALLAYWIVRAQVTREAIDRAEVTDAQNAHQSAAREFASANIEARRRKDSKLFK